MSASSFFESDRNGSGSNPARRYAVRMFVTSVSNNSLRVLYLSVAIWNVKASINAKRANAAPTAVPTDSRCNSSGFFLLR